MTDFEEFRLLILHPSKEKRILVTNSYGTRDAYRWCKDNYPDIMLGIGRDLFAKIVRGVNEYLANRVSLGDMITFPYLMGGLEVVKKKKGAFFKKGKLCVTYPINWNKTLRLWYKDGEAHHKKTLIRDLRKYTFRIAFRRLAMKITNKGFYSFKINRFLHVRMKNNVENGIISDAKDLIR